MAEGVEGPGLDQRLDGPLVEHHRVDPGAEVVEVGERAALLPLGDDALDQALADIADGRQPEWDHRSGRTAASATSTGRLADSCTADGGELRARDVDVGDQHVDAPGPALGQVDGGLVLVILDAGEQRGQVLGRVVGLQPGGLVADEAVAEGVAAVEPVVGEGLDDVEQHLADRPPVPVGLAARPRTWPAPWP